MNIKVVNLSKVYANIPYHSFEKCMKNIGFEGEKADFDEAYKKIGGIIPQKKEKGGE